MTRRFRADPNRSASKSFRVCAAYGVLMLWSTPAWTQPADPQPAEADAAPNDLSPLQEVRQLAKANNARDAGLIVGGTLANYANNPWQIALVDSHNSDTFEAQYCGGSYLGGLWVLTAAHCVANDATADFAVFYGSATLDTSGTRVAVVGKTVHPFYKPSTETTPADFDIALVKLAAPLSTEAISPISPAEFAGVKSGAQIRVSGWGVVNDLGNASRQLLFVEVPLQTNATCNTSAAYNGDVNTNMICAGRPEGGQDACQGDSGGPATIGLPGGRRLIGVVSWGHGCGDPQKYGVYTRVSRFVDWIRQSTK